MVATENMVATDRVNEIFADAHGLYDSAIARLEAGDIRDAADKAWCSVKRASDALILARTGNEPEKSPVTTRELRRLGDRAPDVFPLINRYAMARDFLHGDCFCLGLCEPIDDTERLIRGAIDYIRDCEMLC